MQISTRCSVAVHCLIFICEAGRLGRAPATRIVGSWAEPESERAGIEPRANQPQDTGPVRVTSALLSQSTGTNAASVRAALSALKRAGIVDVARGTGGATLARRAEDVTLLDIYQAVEPTSLDDAIGIHHSGNPDCPVAQNIAGVLRDAYRPAAAAMAKAMRAVTLADMLSDYRRRIGVQDQSAGS